MVCRDGGVRGPCVRQARVRAPHMEETASHIDYNRWGTFSRLFNIDQFPKS